MRKTTKSALLSLAGLGIIVLFFSFQTAPLIDPIEAGKEIYTKGSSPSGKEVIALMSGVKVPATVLPCVNCHGADGKGKPEGGVTPSNLQWSVLSKTNGGQHDHGRRHEAYTDRFLKRAITMGLDPAGNKLHKVMPRYQMTQEDIGYLMAYLKVLGKEKDTGLEEKVIKTGAILPFQKTNPSLQLALKNVLQAFYTEVNEKGGIYGRTFDLQLLEDTSDFSTKATACFAVATGFETTEKNQLADWASKWETPVIGAVSDWPELESLNNEYVFYLYPGILKQIQALLKYQVERKEGTPLNLALLHTATVNNDDLISAIAAKCKELGIHDFQKINVEQEGQALEDLCQSLKNKGVNIVLYLGPAFVENQFLETAQAFNWSPDFLSPGTWSGIQPFQIPNSFDGQVYLAYPTWFDELTNKGWEKYHFLKKKYKLSDAFQHKQLLALGSAMIYVEAVRKCGRDLSRKALVEQIQKLYNYETGLFPPVTYNLNKRVGSEKIYITSVDLEKSILKLERVIE